MTPLLSSAQSAVPALTLSISTRIHVLGSIDSKNVTVTECRRTRWHGVQVSEFPKHLL